MASALEGRDMSKILMSACVVSYDLNRHLQPPAATVTARERTTKSFVTRDNQPPSSPRGEDLGMCAPGKPRKRVRDPRTNTNLASVTSLHES